MVEQDEFAKARGDEKPPYERNQYGLVDRRPDHQGQAPLLRLLARATSATSSARCSTARRGDQAPANVTAILDDYPTGTLSAPLESELYFGKLSWQPTTSQTVDLSYHRRDEEEIRGFGGQRVEEGGRATSRSTPTPSCCGTRRCSATTSFNEASLTWQKLQWKRHRDQPERAAQNYVGLLDVGSKDYIQDLARRRSGSATTSPSSSTGTAATR